MSAAISSSLLPSAAVRMMNPPADPGVLALQNALQAQALFVAGDLARDAHVFERRHVDHVAARQRDVRRDARAFLAQRLLGDLNDDFLAFFQQVGDGRLRRSVRTSDAARLGPATTSRLAGTGTLRRSGLVAFAAVLRTLRDSSFAARLHASCAACGATSMRIASALLADLRGQLALEPRAGLPQPADSPGSAARSSASSDSTLSVFGLSTWTRPDHPAWRLRSASAVEQRSSDGSSWPWPSVRSSTHHPARRHVAAAARCAPVAVFAVGSGRLLGLLLRSSSGFATIVRLL